MNEHESTWVLRVPVLVPRDVEESMDRILDYFYTEICPEQLSSELVRDVNGIQSWIDRVRNFEFRVNRVEFLVVTVSAVVTFFLPELTAFAVMLAGGGG